MAKFNLNQLLSSTSKSNTEQEPKEEKKLQRLNHKDIRISVYDLEPSKDNFYSMEQIADLKTAIELAGSVKQNLLVTQLENGKYKVLAGHRRRLASLSLVEEGKQEYEFVPCTVEEAEKDTELQQIKEELLLILTNSQRNKTDWDKVEEVKRLREVLEKYKKKAKLPGRIREIIAETLNTSPTQVARIDAISKNLTPELQQEMKEQRMGLSVAYEISGLPEEKQQEVLEEYKQKGSITLKDVKDKKEELKQPENSGCPMNSDIPLTEAEIKKFCGKGCSPVCGAELEELLQKKKAKQPEKQQQEQQPEEQKPIEQKPEAAEERAEQIPEPENKKTESLPPLPTIFEILKGMNITELAEWICYRCDGTGAFCDLALECNRSKEAERLAICTKWLKTQAQKR